MPSPVTPDAHQNRLEAEREKRNAALASVFWAFFLTCLKLAAGLATNSLGILSEALHSGLDLVAAGITFFAIRVASRPADKDHPYGYGKVENLSALVETILLLVTCGWIVREAIERLFFDAPQVTPSLWGVGVIAVSLVVDIGRSRMLRHVARKHNSQALEADALHFTTDIWSSGVVLIGLICVWLGSFLVPDSGAARALHMADALAALVVSGIVVLVGIRLSRRAVNALLDGGSLERTEAVERALADKLPDYAIRRLRTRESGANAFVDLTVEAPSSLSLDAAHDITIQVEGVVREVLPRADVTVHVEPHAEDGGDSILQTTRSVAALHGLDIHNVVLSTRETENGEQLLIYLHVEAPPQMTLDQAHGKVAAFEAALGRKLKRASISTHIEPDERQGIGAGQRPSPDPHHVRAAVHETAATFAKVRGVHDLHLERVGGSDLLSFHCQVPGSITVAQAHELATRLEQTLRARIPELGRVDIHTDPLPEEMS